MYNFFYIIFWLYKYYNSVPVRLFFWMASNILVSVLNKKVKTKNEAYNIVCLYTYSDTRYKHQQMAAFMNYRNLCWMHSEHAEWSTI